MLQCVLQTTRRRRENSELPQTQLAEAQDEAAWTRNLKLFAYVFCPVIDTMYILDLAGVNISRTQKLCLTGIKLAC